SLIRRCGGNIGKLIRLTTAINENPSIDEVRPFPFLFLDGLIADLTPWVHCGGHGTVSGISNFAPLATMKLFNLCNNPSLRKDEVMEATRLQAVLSNADVAAVPACIRGMSKSSSSTCTRIDTDCGRTQSMLSTRFTAMEWHRAGHYYL